MGFFDKLFSGEAEMQRLAGVVVGANRTHVLFSKELSDSKLS